MISVAPPERVPAVRAALTQAGAQVLPSRLVRQGLTMEIT